MIGPDGEQTCHECAYDMCSRGYECRVVGCECACGYDPDLDVDPRRARELDDRPRAALESIARDMEAERLPTLDELRAERYGRRRSP